MILNHLWGIYAHPIEEWQTIDNRHESATYSLSHIALIALIPSLMGYYSSVYLGWKIGTGDDVFLTHNSAMLIGIAMYFALIIGVFALSYLAHWMAVTFGAKPTYTQTLELSAYTATPVFMSAFAAFYPELWFVVSVGLAALAYSVYLLYTGVPILMHIPEERGFIYASSVVTCGLVLLVIILAATAILWTNGIISPTFT
ncbi:MULTISPECIES: Yip1 family protein [unclassified Pseudoalteromonas]|uniref:Yip1 family protein n=1 Tax=unclassified Pseudoalteromonas TaxID=194690 RepID=UPI0020972500|nr:Yip1 family protein [Pseudoalteromonas sp. XMcav2-N]MCO7186819.1 YIP1 family protein [Pseudoalteromonas sp. XMcav2-N]